MEPERPEGSMSKAVFILKEKKKKLKAVLRKRHYGIGNLSLRNSTLNSTIFKASLRINNRALAQALEKKKSDLRAAEAIILQQKEEIQLLAAELNKSRILVSSYQNKQKSIQNHLHILSNTLHLSVEQLFETMDTCSDGEFRKLSGMALLATNTKSDVALSDKEQVKSNLGQATSLGPVRVLASGAATSSELDDDDDDDENDSVGIMNMNKELTTNALHKLMPAPCSDLSVIIEQSYLGPTDMELSIVDTESGLRPLNSRDHHMAVAFQPSSSVPDSPIDDENSKLGHVVVRRSRSRSRQHLLPEMLASSTDNLQSINRNGTRISRSSSRDRRNLVIFKPSSTDICGDMEVDSYEGFISHSGINLVKTVSEADSSKHKESDLFNREAGTGVFNKVLELMNDTEGDITLQNGEDFIEETEVLTSELMGQLYTMNNSAQIEIMDEEKQELEESVEQVDETILVSDCQMVDLDKNELLMSSNACEISMMNKEPYGPMTVKGSKPGFSESLKGLDLRDEKSIKGHAKYCKSSSDFSLSETEGLVSGGQFVTRDKIARTPVKVVKYFSRSLEGEDAFGNISRCLIGETSDNGMKSENDSQRKKSLSRRDIPTFLPIEGSPNAATTPGKAKGLLHGKTSKPGNKVIGADRKKSSEGKLSKPATTCGQNNQGTGVSKTLTDHVKGKITTSTQIHNQSNEKKCRRGTFGIAGRTVVLLEEDILSKDIMKEDDTILISESFDLGNDDMFSSGNDLFARTSADMCLEEPKEINAAVVKSSLEQRFNSIATDKKTNVENINDNGDKDSTIRYVEDMDLTAMLSSDMISVVNSSANNKINIDSDMIQNGEGCNNQGAIEVSSSKRETKRKVVEPRKNVNDALVGQKSNKPVAKSKTRKNNPKSVSQEKVQREAIESEDIDQDFETIRNAVKRRKVNTLKLKSSDSSSVTSETEVGKVSCEPITGDIEGAATHIMNNPPQSHPSSKDNAVEKEFVVPQSVDVETKRRFGMYIRKPGNIVFSADRNDAAICEVPKKTRSKSRSTLPIQQKTRSKTSVQLLDQGPADSGSSSVWDFKGTPRSAALKEKADRLLSAFDISLNDSSVIPKPKDDGASLCLQGKSKLRKEVSKDDSFIVEKPASSSSRRVRHESTSAISRRQDSDAESNSAGSDGLQSPHGIMLALGNGKRKPSARSKTVRYEVNEMGQSKEKYSSNSQEATDKVTVNHTGNNELQKISTCSQSEEPRSTDSIPCTNSTLTQKRRTQESSAFPASGQTKKDNNSIAVEPLQKCSGIRQEEDTVSMHNVGGLKLRKDGNVDVALPNDRQRLKKEGTDFQQDKKKTSSTNRKKGTDSVINGKSSENVRLKDVMTNSKDSKNTELKPGSEIYQLSKENDLATEEPGRENKTVSKRNRDRAKLKLTSATPCELSDKRKANVNSQLTDKTTQRRPTSTVEEGQGVLHMEVQEESPEEIIVRKTRKRRIIRSTDLFDDAVESETLSSPKQLVTERIHQNSASTRLEEHGNTESQRSSDILSCSPYNEPGEFQKLSQVCSRTRASGLRSHRNVQVAATKGKVGGHDALESGEQNIDLISETPSNETVLRSKQLLTGSDLPVPLHRQSNSAAKYAKNRTIPRTSNLSKRDSGPNSNQSRVNSGLDEAKLDLPGTDENRDIRMSIESSSTTTSNDTSQEITSRRSRRAATTAVSYKEPSLGKKLRCGDRFTSTIYPGADCVQRSDNSSTAKAKVKILSTMDNLITEQE